MAKPKYVTIMKHQWGKVVIVMDEQGNQYRMNFEALQKVLVNLIDTDWFKDKKPKWKYKRLNYEETYKHLLYNPGIHRLINEEEFKK
jgi:hypothetical protein